MYQVKFTTAYKKRYKLMIKKKEEPGYMSAIPAAKNEPIDTKIRKFRDTLITGGFAIIAFGIWTVIKSIMEAFTILKPMIGNMTLENLTQVQEEQFKELVESNALFYAVMLLILAFLVVDMLLRIYVGLSARAIGLQKKKRNGKERSGIVWLIFGVILTAFNVYSLVVSLVQIRELLQTYSIMHYVISLFVDVTSIFVTAELIFTGFRLRKLTKTQKGSKEVRDAA